MKFFLIICTLLLLCNVIYGQIEAYEDNDFAEFEDFDTEDDFTTGGNEQWTVGGGADGQQNDKNDLNEKPTKSESLGQQSSKDNSNAKSSDFVEVLNDRDDDDGVVEDDDNEFEHFQDEEEFEGFDVGDSKEQSPDHKIGEPKLTVAKVPPHFRNHWDSYSMEMLMLAGLTIYFANFFLGKNKNSKLANLWLNTHRSLLEENFVLVGDDGKLENESPGFIKESESLYTLWCSGRTCCEGMLVELRMIKRQDLVALISGLMRPVRDQVHIKVEISKDSMDSFVFCVGTKKTATKLFKEMSDLNKYCSLVNKPEDKYSVPSGFAVLSEIPEATSTILDSRVLTALDIYGQLIDYIHISDQFSGPIQQEDPNNLKQPDVKKVLMCGFNLPTNNCDMETVKPLLILVFYLMERLKRYRLSKEGKQKAEKNRLRVEEAFLKSTHVARAEAAAQRREEKRKQEKERVMAEDDPEKQRRWEQKEQKRQAKKKAPKMKRLAVKSL